MTPAKTEAKVTGLDVAIRTADVADLWSRDQVNLLLKEYAAKGTTVEEFSAFLIIAKNLSLDPFQHEIWLPDFDGTGRDRSPYVGRDGLLAIAERSGQFDGLVSGVVCEGDEFEPGLDKPVHRFAPGERGRILYAYAYVWRKDRRVPTSVIAPRATFLDPKLYDDQGKMRTGGVTKTPWFRFPDLMLKKVAEANALRLCFKVSGVVAVADNATPVDQADVIDGEAVEIVEESSPDGPGRPPGRGSTTTPRSASSPPNEGAPHTADDAAGQSASPVTPSGEHLFDTADAEAAAAGDEPYEDPA